MVIRIGYWNPSDCTPTKPIGFPRPCLGWHNYNRILDYLKIDASKNTFIGYHNLGTVEHNRGININGNSKNDTHVQETMRYDNGSLFGAMANFEIDLALQLATAKVSRLQFFSFGLPFRFDRFCMFLRKPNTRTPTDSPWYFLDVFGSKVWLSALATLTVFCLLQIVSKLAVQVRREPKASKLDSFIGRIISLKLDSYIRFLTFGVLCYIYNSCMCANFVKSGRRSTPIRTIDHAIESIRKGTYRLTLDVFALELIRTSRHYAHSNDFTDLAEAFEHNPPRVIGNTGCPITTDQAFETNELYFATEKNVCFACHMDAIQKLYRVCFSGYPLFIGLMFKRGSRLVERSSRAIPFLLAHDHRTLQWSYLTQKLDTLQDALVVNSDIRQLYPVLNLNSHASIVALLWVSGLFASILTLVVEIYWYTRHFPMF